MSGFTPQEIRVLKRMLGLGGSGGRVASAASVSSLDALLAAKAGLADANVFSGNNNTFEQVHANVGLTTDGVVTIEEGSIHANLLTSTRDYELPDDDGTFALLTDIPAAGQASIQWKDEGTDKGALGGITTIDFVGAGVTAADAGATLTVTIPGGGGLSDGDYGDIVVSGAGTVLSIDSGVATAAGRALMDDASAADQRTTLGLGTMATVSPTGTPDGTKYLRDDNSWQAVSGSGLTHPQVCARGCGV